MDAGEFEPPIEKSGDAARSRRPLLTFFALVFVLSVPFWLAGALVAQPLLPGLPASALMAFCPLIAALLVVYRWNKAAGVRALLKKAFDYGQIRAKAWYVPIVLLMPGVALVSFALMRWTGVPVPVPQFSALPTLILALAFFVAALGEELGWTGYAIDPMQDRWGALPAALVLGSVWAVWHFVPLLQAGRTPAWIAWWSLGTVAMRVIMVWIYDNAGKSVFAVAVLHAAANLAWQLFPVHGSYFDPRIDGLILATVAAALTILWGSKSMARRSRR
jgi:uncharacterized protein